MKLGLFSDSHYSSAELTCGKRHNRKALERMERVLQQFAKEQCDLVICLGDVIDKEAEHAQEVENLKKVSALFSQYSMPIFALMGNHDAFTFETEDFYKILGEKYRPVNQYSANGNLIFLDACHFQNGAHYMPGHADWTDTFLPDIDKLESLLESTEGDIYLFVHQNLDPAISEDHRISNAVAHRQLFEKNGRVKAVFQGHYHRGNICQWHGIQYVTMAALCENESAYSVFEI